MATVTELLPLLFPLGDGILEGAGKVCIFTFVGMDGLLSTFEFDGDAFEILALDKGTLGGVSVDAKTILLVFLAGLVDVGFLRLLRFELFLNYCLIGFTVLCLTSDKGRDGIFEFVPDLLCELDVEARLLVSLLSQGIERVAEFA